MLVMRAKILNVKPWAKRGDYFIVLVRKEDVVGNRKVDFGRNVTSSVIGLHTVNTSCSEKTEMTLSYNNNDTNNIIITRSIIIMSMTNYRRRPGTRARPRAATAAAAPPTHCLIQ